MARGSGMFGRRSRSSFHAREDFGLSRMRGCHHRISGKLAGRRRSRRPNGRAIGRRRMGDRFRFGAGNRCCRSPRITSGRGRDHCGLRVRTGRNLSRREPRSPREDRAGRTSRFRVRAGNASRIGKLSAAKSNSLRIVAGHRSRGMSPAKRRSHHLPPCVGSRARRLRHSRMANLAAFFGPTSTVT